MCYQFATKWNRNVKSAFLIEPDSIFPEEEDVIQSLDKNALIPQYSLAKYGINCKTNQRFEHFMREIVKLSNLRKTYTVPLFRETKVIIFKSVEDDQNLRRIIEQAADEQKQDKSNNYSQVIEIDKKVAQLRQIRERDGWDSIVLGQDPERVPIPGNHYEVFQEEGIKIICSRISKEMNGSVV